MAVDEVKLKIMTELKAIAEAAFDVGDISMKSRKKKVINARSWFCKTAYDLQMLGASYEEIGQFMAGRDHATALHARNMYPTYLKFDKFKLEHARADQMFAEWRAGKEYRRWEASDPIAWRDRYIQRLKSLVRKYQQNKIECEIES